MSNRRKLLIAIGASAFAAPLRAFAQQTAKVWRIGFLYNGSRQSALETGRYGAFLEGMRELGYVEGRNFVLESRFNDGQNERLAGISEELVRSKVDVIVATGSPTVPVLQRATKTIPVVVAIAADPVASGFVTSLARPGGNVTGLSVMAPDVVPKALELLALVVPRLSRVAVLLVPTNPGHVPELKAAEDAARKRGIRTLRVSASNREEIERGFAQMAHERVDAVLILVDTFFVQQRRQIAELALKNKLPSVIYGEVSLADSGGLMAYGPNLNDNYRRAAVFVDKILKGAKPGDLPFEQPTRFYLTVNQKTAKALKLALPQELLLRADRVIER